MAINEFIEIRCVHDKTLLFRTRGTVSGQLEIETKCRRCKKTRIIKLPRMPREDMGGTEYNQEVKV